MEKKHTVQRISNKKRGRPKVRFNFMVIVIIALITFAVCFVLYMIKANVSGDALNNDNDTKERIQEATTSVQTTEAASSAGSEETTEPLKPGPDPSIKYPLPATAAVDPSYFGKCCMIADKTLLDMPNHTSFKDVLGNEALNAFNCNTASITSTYGNVTAAQTIQLKKPENLYVMLGCDIGVNSTDDMISSYTSMINQLHNYLPEMHIYIMQLPPAPAGSMTVTVEAVDQYNSKLLEMAKTLGVYCIDTNTALRSAEGTISEEYWDYESGKLSEKGCKAISDYILTHTN